MKNVEGERVEIERVEVVVCEAGNDWAGQTERQSARATASVDIVTIVQWPTESAAAFAERVASRLSELQPLGAASLVCTSASDRASIAARRRIVQAAMQALSATPARELSLYCPPTTQGRLPQWAAGLVAAAEASDPALEVFVECEGNSVAA